MLTGDEEITSHNLFDRINTKKAAEGDEAEPKSELKYPRQILEIKDNQPELFQRILALPRKARSTRNHAPETPALNSTDAPPAVDRPAVISYFRQGRLDKFLRAHAHTSFAKELDFFTTAETLETKPTEARHDIPPEQFYPLPDKNKAGFLSATSPTIESLLPAIASGTGNAGIILKRLRAKAFRTAVAFGVDDKKFRLDVETIIADGRVGHHTLRKIREGFDKTTEPVSMLAILRKEIAGQYLLGRGHKANPSAVTVGEVILFCYLR